MKKKVVVAMSGGVDSSVAASLLKEKGYEVRGVFLDFWKDNCSKEENKCCNLDSKKRAREVARILDIPFYVLDFREEFKKRVVDYFIGQYKNGFTPNPCIECNKRIKFGFLFDKIKILGGDYLATGHYVKRLRVKDEYKVYRAEDNKKDQSYFLYNLNQNKLAHLLFPVGDYTKDKVRNLAKKYKLPTAKTRESQDVCFVEGGDLEKFLKRYIKPKPGLIVNTRGEKIGHHRGLPFYTIGQRKGIEIGGGKPYYVAEKDVKNNILVVTDDSEDKRIFSKEFRVHNISWVGKEYTETSSGIDVLTRYRQKPTKAAILKYDKVNKACLVKLENVQRAVTSGQSAVFYKENELLGGGIIGD